MNLARVIGNIWATRKYETLQGKKLMLIQPLDSDLTPTGSPLAAVDTVRAGPGELVCYITSREAILPLDNDVTPVDCALVGIVDRVDLGKMK